MRRRAARRGARSMRTPRRSLPPSCRSCWRVPCRRRVRRGSAPSPRRWRRSTPQSPVCRRLRKASSPQLFALLALPPVRLGFARVLAPWPTRRPAEVRRCLDRFRESSWALPRAAYDALHQTHVRRVVRQPASVARDRLPRPARPWDERWPETKIIDPVAAGIASGWDVDRRVATASATHAGSRRRHRRNRRGWRHRGGDSRRRRLARRAAGGRTAAHRRAISTCANPKPIRELYQESAARKTKDKAINILQGRCVGGGTTVNWTSSFRTPPATLAYWQREFGLDRVHGRSDGAMVRENGGAAVRSRRGRSHPTPTTRRWRAARASSASRRGDSAATSRAARTSAIAAWAARPTPSSRCSSRRIPGALDRGATLVTRVRAQRVLMAGERVTDARRHRDGCRRRRADRPQGHGARALRTSPPRAPSARRRCCCAAACRTRTPRGQAHVSASRPWSRAALMPERVDGFAGAPQSIYSRSLPRHAADRRPDRLQARGAAAASDPDRDDTAR